MKRCLVIVSLAILIFMGVSQNPAFSQCLQDKTTTAQAFVNNFYRWFATTNGYTEFAKQRSCFTPEFAALLEKEQKGDSSDCESFLDYDPFAQTNGFSPQETKAKVVGDEMVAGKTQVSVELSYPDGKEIHRIKLELVKNPYWQISDLLEPVGKGTESRRLSEVLKSMSQEIDKCLKKKPSQGPAKPAK